MVRAIYGGSFNPIHWGHLGLVRWVVEHTDVEELWLMVTPNNPLKDKTILASEESRYEAAKAAVEREGLKSVIVSDFEFSLPRPNYTAQTLRYLSARYPNDEWVLLIGEDNWRLFPQWREWMWILENYRVFVYPRHSDGSVPFLLPDGKVKNVQYLAQAPYFDISSTKIREKIKNK